MRVARRGTKLSVMTTLQLRDHLQSLSTDRHATADEIEAARAAYVGAAVTEIATFRAQLSGAQQG
jgi:hypothetical protein